MNGKDTEDNCKVEYQYSCSNKTVKKMICLVMEPCMRDPKKWEGILGLRFSTKMYIDMAGDLNNADYLSRQIELLCLEMDAHGLPSRSNYVFSVIIIHMKYNYNLFLFSQNVKNIVLIVCTCTAIILYWFSSLSFCSYSLWGDFVSLHN